MRRLLRQRDSDDSGFTLVELLVAVSLIGIVGAAVMSVVVSTSRAQVYQSDLREVMDDGRVSIGRIRKEVRQARSVLPGSTASQLRFWVDENQDNIVQEDEERWYCVRPVGGSSCVGPSPVETKFELVRWTEATDGWDWTNVPPVPPAGATVIASTLLTVDVLQYLADGVDVSATPEEANVVTFSFDLDFRTGRIPDQYEATASVRLRNVE